MTDVVTSSGVSSEGMAGGMTDVVTSSGVSSEGMAGGMSDVVTSSGVSPEGMAGETVSSRSSKGVGGMTDVVTSSGVSSEGMTGETVSSRTSSEVGGMADIVLCLAGSCLCPRLRGSRGRTGGRSRANRPAHSRCDKKLRNHYRGRLRRILITGMVSN
uniref:Uncharacterized protein n=1 Tax=Sinocyclocheilus rhinocerous TaxID=307959 RepID=A0A673GCR0_9TELE